jgi:hypothetical protein
MSFLSKIKKSSDTKDDTEEGVMGDTPPDDTDLPPKQAQTSGYVITAYSKKQAKKEKVEIKPSTRKTKKIDVFKDGKKVASIGGVRANGTPYKDYPTYLKELGKEGAEKKRKAYLARHAKEPKSKDGEKTPSYYADVILW